MEFLLKKQNEGFVSSTLGNAKDNEVNLSSNCRGLIRLISMKFNLYHLTWN